MKKYFVRMICVGILALVIPGLTHAQVPNNNEEQIKVLMQLLQKLQAQLADMQAAKAGAAAPVVQVYKDKTITYGQTMPLGWSGQGFFDGEKLFVVEVDVKNTANKSQKFAADSFIVKNAQGVSFLPIRLSAIKGQPRVMAGTGMSSLGTNRPEIISMTLDKDKEAKGVLVFYVAEKPMGQYTIEHAGVVTNLVKF